MNNYICSNSQRDVLLEEWTIKGQRLVLSSLPADVRAIQRILRRISLIIINR